LKKIVTTAAALILIALIITPLSGVGQTPGDPKRIEVVRTPGGGIQPQVSVGKDGVVHLIYFKGKPSAGDIFYVKKAAGEKEFSSPLRVNSQPGSAIAAGSVRGAHIAVGRDGRVHVAWMGSRGAEPKGPSGADPMLYARMNDAATMFEPQRNLITRAVGLDGGGSLTADPRGNVYVAWHAGEEAKGEAHRRVWVAVSRDEGRSFGREVPATDEALGACGCCGMRAYAGEDGTLYLMYRAATRGVDRDMYLVTSKDRGKSFTAELIAPWKLEACPMSTTSFGGAGIVKTAWETNNQVYYTDAGGALTTDSARRGAVASAPGRATRRKHPSIAVNSRGETLLAWTERTDWEKGGGVAWAVFDRSGQPTAERGTAEGVPVWGLVAAYARPDGGFTIIY
jgi:hypothetical protein